MKKVTILGAGNAGHALAYDLSKRGYEVMLYEHPKFAKSLEGIRQRGGIESVATLEMEGKSIPGTLAGFTKIAHLTTNIKEAMAFSNLICLSVPAYAHKEFFQPLLPELKEGMTLILLPGNFGSLVFKKLMEEAGIQKSIKLIETASIPYAVRVIAPGKIFILAKKSALSAGVIGGTKKDIKMLSELIDIPVDAHENVLGAGFSNVNLIIHVPTAILGMGPMESRGGKFHFYSEGVSPSVAKVLEKEDKERIAVAKAFDIKPSSFVEIINRFYALHSTSILDFAQNTPIHNLFPNDAPKSPKDRYIAEDCPYLLVPTYQLGAIANVSCPTMESLIRIAGIYNDVDYFKEGLTLDKLGLRGKSVEKILEWIR